MRPRSRPFSRLILALAIVLWGIAACGEDPTAPEGRDVFAAKGSGAGGPSVDATDPESAPQDTTLDVRVIGSGFDNGSKVAFLLDGKATTKVRTNSTQFVSGGELIANITIAVDAIPDRYDVQVTTARGKKGVGIELFAITPNRFGQVALEITFRDDAGDGLRSDEVTGLSYCDPGVPCYEEGRDDVGAHLSGNGNLLFWLGSVDDPNSTTTRRIRVLGQLLLTRRIYTNDNQDSQGVTVPDLRAMVDGTISARFVVERGEIEGHLRYGVNCFGSLNERDDANGIPNERVSVTRSGDSWTIEGWGARLCEQSGKGRNTTITETPVWAPFRMTMIAIPWPE